LDLSLTRAWLRNAATALKLGLMVVKAITIAYGIPVPFPLDSEQSRIQREATESLLKDVIDHSADALLDECEDTFEKSGKNLDLAIDQKQVSHVIGPAYDLIAKTALSPGNHEKWKDKIVPVFNDSGELIWVKKEYAELYARKPVEGVPSTENLDTIEYPEGDDGQEDPDFVARPVQVAASSPTRYALESNVPHQLGQKSSEQAEIASLRKQLEAALRENEELKAKVDPIYDSDDE